MHAWLEHLHAGGFTAAPRPLGRDEHGREVLSWIDGDVAVPPYPDWARGDRLLDSAARLLRRMHDAALGFDASPYQWSDEVRDPAGGSVMCHSDLCLENIVTRRGAATAFLDFDFVAPGRPIWDVVSTARFLVPLRSPERRDPWQDDDAMYRRLRRFADVYGLTDVQRSEFVPVMEQRRVVGERFVLARAEREPLFAHWRTSDGRRKLEAERTWIATNGERVTATLFDE